MSEAVVRIGPAFTRSGRAPSPGEAAWPTLALVSVLVPRKPRWSVAGRERLLLWNGPGPFAGIATGDWLALLRANRFAVDPP